MLKKPEVWTALPLSWKLPLSVALPMIGFTLAAGAGLNFHMGALFGEVETPQKLVSIRQTLGLVLAGLFLAMTLLCWLAARALQGRLRDLSLCLGRIADGDYGATCTRLQMADEFGQIEARLYDLQSELQLASAADEERQNQQQHQDQMVHVLTQGLKQLAKGDFSNTLDQPFPSSHEELRKNFNQTVKTLNATV